jgi:hypothetical protein
MISFFTEPESNMIVEEHSDESGIHNINETIKSEFIRRHQTRQTKRR